MGTRRSAIGNSPRSLCESGDLDNSEFSSDVFERRTSIGSEVFALFSRDFEQILGHTVSLRIKTLSNTNSMASKHIKREKGSLPVDVRRSKTLLL